MKVFFFWVTKMKSLPRPWYLTKWRKPVSRRSKKATVEAFSAAAPRVMEEEDDDAETWRQELGLVEPLVLALRKLGCRRGLKEENDRRAAGDGDDRGAEMAAAIAMTV